ncbi:patatin-like phospholipase family protein, partial [Lachnoclostridium sp. MSJ-17]|uniref:patatin-like phospholipase family protein n=1 Tax=Lachnoclostridium sp. MSJ-17 TaxID=2841516 RepID=UPI001C0F63A7
MDRTDRKNAIGFALSGGGLQGIAHIGAIKALYELGIHPQFVSGTSSGAAMAAICAMGMTPEEMRYFAKKHWKTLAEIDSGLIFKALATFIINKKVDKDGIKDGQLIADVVKEGMLLKGIRGFRDLPINLSICTVDTLTTDECIFLTENEGLHNDHIHYLTDVPLDVAVRASMSFPAIYTTCDYGNYNFIDGGSKDNLPVKVLKDMGVGKVLAIGFDIMAYDPDAGLDGLIKVIWRALDVYSIDGTRKSQKLADLAIEIKNENTQL